MTPLERIQTLAAAGNPPPTPPGCAELANMLGELGRVAMSDSQTSIGNNNNNNRSLRRNRFSFNGRKPSFSWLSSTSSINSTAPVKGDSLLLTWQSILFSLSESLKKNNNNLKLIFINGWKYFGWIPPAGLAGIKEWRFMSRCHLLLRVSEPNEETRISWRIKSDEFCFHVYVVALRIRSQDQFGYPDDISRSILGVASIQLARPNTNNQSSNGLTDPSINQGSITRIKNQIAPLRLGLPLTRQNGCRGRWFSKLKKKTAPSLRIEKKAPVVGFVLIVKWLVCW